MYFIFVIILFFAQKSSQEIQTAIETVIKEQELVGTQAAIMLKGEIIYKHSWGLANQAFSVPVTDDTRFLIASITKAITGHAIHILQYEGLIDLDKPIQTYLPDFPKKSEKAITIRLLLNHRSGVRHYFRGETDNAQFFDANYETATAALEKFKNDSLLFEPDTGMQYSSFGYTILAAIVEQVKKCSFREYLQTELFSPNSLSHIDVPDWRYPVKNLASSYSFFLGHLGATNSEPFEARRLNFSYNAGGGNLVSNSLDLLKLGSEIFKSFKENKPMYSDIVASGIPGYAYGWNLDRDENARLVFNATGASEAYQGALTVWPDQDLLIVTLSNTWGKNSRQGGFTLSLAKTIASIILD
ncbi:MAG: beta-lactamase family protein [Calditrichaeota bacterium]|nr:beta-lactamase family protein [Calditrichota bacterium]